MMDDLPPLCDMAFRCSLPQLEALQGVLACAPDLVRVANEEAACKGRYLNTQTAARVLHRLAVEVAKTIKQAKGEV